MDPKKIANTTKVDRHGLSVSPERMTRLLGEWRTNALVGPGYVRLAASIRALIADGRLPLGIRLPAERRLAEELGLSRTTVSGAYAILAEQRYLESRRGSGSWSTCPTGHEGGGDLSFSALPGDWLDLAVAAPAGGEEVLDALGEAAQLLPKYLAGHGYEPQGLIALRTAIAQAYRRRGLPTDPSQIFATNGAQQAIELLAEVLVSPRDRVVLDSPTYPGALDVFARARASLLPVPTDAQGGDREQFVAAIRRGRPKAVYVIPEFHNPTGYLMPVETREAIVGAVGEVDGYVIADETFVELALDGVEMPPPLAACGPQGAVVSIGSMSKAYWGGLRIGWIRAQPQLIARLVRARARLDMAGPVIDQLVAGLLLASPSGALDLRRRALERQRDVLVESLTQKCPSWTTNTPSGGLCLWVDLGAPMSSALAAAASSHRVRLVGGSRFGPDGMLERYLRMPYSLAPEKLAEAVARLAVAAADLEGITNSSYVA